MNAIVLTLIAFLPLFCTHAEETEYQKDLQKLWDNFAKLDAERADYRKPHPKLTPAQEQEWLRLRGQLLRDDPIRTLSTQLDMDIQALAALRSPTDADKAILEDLKDLLASMAECQDRATTLAEATAWATTLRQFVARRDVGGLTGWMKEKFP